MKGKQLKWKAAPICWHRFTRHHDAAFLSMGREIRIGVLSVATLTFATPNCATAQVSIEGTERTWRTEDARKTGETELDEVEVAAARVPLPLEQAARIVGVVTREEIKECPAGAINDVLKYMAGVDVRQRGTSGIQTDIGIEGGTHDQVVVLLNGVNISSPHTGHLTADFPCNISDIERIEILEGAASRVYGSNAFSGAINIVTKGHDVYGKGLSGKAGLHGGSYGTLGGEISMHHAQSISHRHSCTISNHLSGGYKRSDGATENSDFNRMNAFYQGDMELKGVNLSWQAGMSRGQYGANTFYSGKFPEQYEESGRYMVSVSARTKGRIALAPTVYWQRSLDHYQLVRGLSPTQENYHRTDVYGANVNAQMKWQGGITAVGTELRNEGILSTALGKPMEREDYVRVCGSDRQYTKRDRRTNVCYYLEHDLLFDKVTVSLGIMANMNTGLDERFRLYPGVDVSYRIGSGGTLFAAWNMAQRMPTFTDLYYKSPTQVGYANLSPERTSEFCVGAKYQAHGIVASLRAYHRQESSMIDWVLPTDSVEKYGRGVYTTYHATNLRTRKMGFSLSVNLRLNEWAGERSVLRNLNLQYSYIHQRRYDDVEIDDSYYGVNYLRHKVVASLTARIAPQVTATLTYRFQDRRGTFYEYDMSQETRNAYGWRTYPFLRKANYKPFSLLDLQVQWKRKRWGVYATLNNLTNVHYIDIGNVRQPGFWLTGGVKLDL